MECCAHFTEERTEARAQGSSPLTGSALPPALHTPELPRGFRPFLYCLQEIPSLSFFSFASIAEAPTRPLTVLNTKRVTDNYQRRQELADGAQGPRSMCLQRVPMTCSRYSLPLPPPKHRCSPSEHVCTGCLPHRCWPWFWMPWTQPLISHC